MENFFLGIQQDHLSSVALFKNEELIYFNQEERLSRKKKDRDIPFKCLEEIKNKFKKVNVAIVTGYDSGSYRSLSKYLINIGIIENKNKLINFHKSHHLAHAIKSFYSSGFDNAIVFVVDGKGSSYLLNNGSIGFETTSVYEIDHFNIKCIFKKILTEDFNLTNDMKVNYTLDNLTGKKTQPISIDENTIFEISSMDLGHFYGVISSNFNWSENEGKLMGLSAYGKYDLEIEKIFKNKDFFIEEDGGKKVNSYKYKELDIEKIENETKLLNLSYMAQKKFEDDYLNLLSKILINKKNKNVILTGGTALNVVNNYKLKKNFLKDYNLYIEPVCGDEGNSIGIAQLYIREIYKKKEKLNFNIKNLYLGPKYNYIFNLNSSENSLKNVSLDYIVDLIIQQKIVALYQDKAEAGPRALGNRSLLFDSRNVNSKNILNKIKKRENFRPFACSILEEEVHNWFDLGNLKKTEHMMYAPYVKENKKNIISSVVHVDNTCRVQTVSQKDNFVLYNILKLFFEKTKVPLLINTSFNLKEEPIVETPDDAINSFRNSDLQYLFFSDIKTLIIKK
jgi:carbamoyltransferase